MAGLMVATTGHRINAIRNVTTKEVESAVRTKAGYTIYVSTEILLSNGSSIAGLTAIKIWQGLKNLNSESLCIYIYRIFVLERVRSKS